jgi:hypothetical protein
MNPFATLVAQVTREKPKALPRLSFVISYTYRPRAKAAQLIRILMGEGRPMTATELAMRSGIKRERIFSALGFCATHGIVRKELIDNRTVYTLIKKS